MEAIDLHATERTLRGEYLNLREAGMTCAHMAREAELPVTTISMWLSGYREVKKVAVLQALIDALPRLKVDPLS